MTIPFDRFKNYNLYWNTVGHITVFKYDWDLDKEVKLGDVIWNSDTSPEFGYSVSRENNDPWKPSHFDDLEDALNSIIGFERVPVERRFDKE